MIRRLVLSVILLVLSQAVAIAAYNPANIPVVSNIAALKALGAASSLYTTVEVQGYNNQNDGGGGIFLWAPASTATADSCTIFAATGVATGRWLRQIQAGIISVEQCGAYNNASNGTATRTAWQAAVNYILGSSNPGGTILCQGPSYLFDTTGVQIFSSSSLAPSFKCGPSAGTPSNGNTQISFSPGSPTPALFFKGTSGGFCGCDVSGLLITGNSNTIGVEDDGLGGLSINIGTGTASVGVLLCSCTTSDFTEFVRIKLTTQGATVTPLKYSVTSGAGSFHGSGLVGGTAINLDGTNPGIVIGSGSLVYDAPLEGSYFTPGSGASTLIQNNSTAITNQLYKGNFGVEQFSSGLFTMATTNPVIFTGDLQTWGTNGNLSFGTFHQARKAETTPGGDFRIQFDPIGNAGNFASGTSKVIAPYPPQGSYNEYAATVQFSDTNYSYMDYGLVFEDGFGNYGWYLIHEFAFNNSAGFGSPTFSVSASGLTASNASYTSNTSFIVTLTMIGPDINHPL